MKDEDFAYAGNGQYTSLIDASGPYGKSAPNVYYLLGQGDGGGGGNSPTDGVMETSVGALEFVEMMIGSNITLKDLVNILYTEQTRFAPRVQSVYVGNGELKNQGIASNDSIENGFGKLQGQINFIRDGAGRAEGFVALDSDGKIPVSHLPSSVFRFMGHYDVATNTPELKDDDNALQGGEVYQCSTAGTFNGINLAVGDLIVYEYATKKWVKSLASGEVISVNNMTGNVELNGGNIKVGIVDTRTIQEALESVAPKVKSIINLNEDKASGHIEFAGIRWGYERTNPASGRQFFQAVGESVPIAYMQKAFYDAGIEMQKNTSAVATSTKTFYDTLALTEMKEWCVVHILIYHELWRVNQLVLGTTEQKLIIWAEQVV